MPKRQKSCDKRGFWTVKAEYRRNKEKVQRKKAFGAGLTGFTEILLTTNLHSRPLSLTIPAFASTSLLLTIDYCFSRGLLLLCKYCRYIDPTGKIGNGYETGRVYVCSRAGLVLSPAFFISFLQKKT